MNRTATSDTAAVAVALKPGVEALSRREATAIRTLVAGAFAIPAQNIKLADDRLRDYPHADGASGGLSEEEDRTRQTVLSTVENLLGRIYRPSEFVVGVLVDLSTHTSLIQKRTYAPDGISIEKSSVKETETTVRSPGAVVGVDPNVSGGLGAAAPVQAIDRTSRERRETTNETHISHVDEKVDVPAGEVKGLSVNVVLDRNAVRRVLQAEEWLRMTPAEQKATAEADISEFTVNGAKKKGFDEAVEAHRKAQSDFLLDQIPMSGAKVNVSAVVFPKPEMPAAGSTATLSWASELVRDPPRRRRPRRARRRLGDVPPGRAAPHRHPAPR